MIGKDLLVLIGGLDSSWHGISPNKFAFWYNIHYLRKFHLSLCVVPAMSSISGDEKVMHPRIHAICCAENMVKDG